MNYWGFLGEKDTYFLHNKRKTTKSKTLNQRVERL